MVAPRCLAMALSARGENIVLNTPQQAWCLFLTPRSAPAMAERSADKGVAARQRETIAPPAVVVPAIGAGDRWKGLSSSSASTETSSGSIKGVV